MKDYMYNITYDKFLQVEVINILVALAGITGIGKSYYKDKIMREIKF